MLKIKWFYIKIFSHNLQDDRQVFFIGIDLNRQKVGKPGNEGNRNDAMSELSFWISTSKEMIDNNHNTKSKHLAMKLTEWKLSSYSITKHIRLQLFIVLNSEIVTTSKTLISCSQRMQWRQNGRRHHQTILKDCFGIYILILFTHIYLYEIL